MKHVCDHLDEVKGGNPGTSPRVRGSTARLRAIHYHIKFVHQLMVVRQKTSGIGTVQEPGPAGASSINHPIPQPPSGLQPWLPSGT